MRRRYAWRVAALSLGWLAVGCQSQGSGDSALTSAPERPNGTPTVKVGFNNGVPQLAQGQARAMPPTQPVASARPAASKLTWDVPGTWTSVTPSSSMRLAQYRIPHLPADSEDAELAVFYFGPEGAGEVEPTFARWLKGFEPQDAQQAKRSKLDGGKLTIELLEAVGTYRSDPSMGASQGAVVSKPGTRFLGAVVQSADGPYYFKLLGPQTTVANAKDAFLQVLQSCRTKTP